MDLPLVHLVGEELGIPFRFPAEHPFNPLQHLRLALACDSRPAAVKRIFESLWITGANANEPARFQTLCAELGVRPDDLGSSRTPCVATRRTRQPRRVRRAELRHRRRGVLGADSIEFVKAFLANKRVLRNDEMRRVDNLPVGAARKA